MWRRGRKYRPVQIGAFLEKRKIPNLVLFPILDYCNYICFLLDKFKEAFLDCMLQGVEWDNEEMMNCRKTVIRFILKLNFLGSFSRIARKTTNNSIMTSGLGADKSNLLPQNTRQSFHYLTLDFQSPTFMLCDSGYDARRDLKTINI
jgi:hypothetical protein